MVARTAGAFRQPPTFDVGVTEVVTVTVVVLTVGPADVVAVVEGAAVDDVEVDDVAVDDVEVDDVEVDDVEVVDAVENEGCLNSIQASRYMTLSPSETRNIEGEIE